MNEPVAKRKILFGVTSPMSLMLLGAIPETMARAGWEVHIVSGPPLDAEYRKSQFPNAQLHFITMGRRVSLLSDSIALIHWILLLSRVRPDVISVGTPKAGLLGILASWLTFVPRRVYVQRGLRLEKTSGARHLALQIIEVVVCRMSTHVIPVSLSLAEELKKIPAIPRHKLEVLGFGSSKGVDLEKFRPFAGSMAEFREIQLRYEVSAEKFILGFVGRVSWAKGAHVLREASNYLIEFGLDHQVVLVGPDELGQPIQEFLDGFVADTHWLGQLEDVAPLYWVFDVMCLPTFREGFPNVLLEAAASSVPIVTSDATGARDFVVNGATGLLAAQGDSFAVANAILKIMKDGTLRKTIIEGARREVKMKYASDKVAESNLNFYERIVDGSDP